MPAAVFAEKKMKRQVEKKSAREIVIKVTEVVVQTSPELKAELEVVEFAPTKRPRHDAAQSNWQLAIFPPVSPQLCEALDRAAAEVQRRWDMVLNFPGRPAWAMSGSSIGPAGR